MKKKGFFGNVEIFDVGEIAPKCRGHVHEYYFDIFYGTHARTGESIWIRPKILQYALKMFIELNSSNSSHIASPGYIACLRRTGALNMR